MLEELGLSEKVLVFPLFPNYFSFSIPVVVDNWNVQTCIVVGYQLLCHLRNFFSIIFKNTSSDSFNQDRDLVQSEDLEAQMVKNPPATRETWVRSLGQEDPLEKGMATHSSILAWRIPWTEESGGLQSMGSKRIEYDWSDLACMQSIEFIVEWTNEYPSNICWRNSSYPNITIHENRSTHTQSISSLNKRTLFLWIKRQNFCYHH